MTVPSTIILLAPPGGGKGTQAKLLVKQYQMSHLSTGQMIREAIQGGTLLGEKAAGFVKAGLLVPDETILEVVRERLLIPGIKNLGVIFDGFPRTVVQAEALGSLLREVNRSLNRVVSLELPHETVVQRLAARRVCEQCEMEYNLLFYPSKVPGICDQCGGNLIQRDDDSEEIIRNRLRVSEDARLALKDFYEKQGLLREVDGDGTVDQVFKRLVEALEL